MADSLAVMLSCYVVWSGSHSVQREAGDPRPVPSSEMGRVTGAGTYMFADVVNHGLILCVCVCVCVCALQDLLSVEARLEEEYGCEDSDDKDRGYEEGGLFCPACNKLFKSEKA